jgi:hypothetical protein
MPPATPSVLSYQHHAPIIDVQAKTLARKGLLIVAAICISAGVACFGALLLDRPDPGDLRDALLLSALYAWLALSGLAYWTCERGLRHNSPTAALVAMILACVHLALLAMMLLASIVATLFGIWIALMPLILASLISLGLLDLIRHLHRCARSFTHLPRAA